MGLASSSIRYIFLENRNADITRTLSYLSAEKMTLARESVKLSQDYTNALNSKSLKLSHNNGATYVDMSYANLMSPNSTNSSKPIFITDAYGRVVVNDKYKKYAEMLSANGAPADLSSIGDWQNSDIRIKVLANATGLTPEQLKEYNSGSGVNTITAEQKSLIEFYDTIFLTIATNGWDYNENVNNNEYLNDTLQNGYYYLTTYEKEYDSNGGYFISYNTDLAVNNSEVFQVNNSSKNDAALAKFEALKAKLTSKETMIDTRMKNLETEQSANKAMMESIKNTMDKNIERTMDFNA